MAIATQVPPCPARAGPSAATIPPEPRLVCSLPSSSSTNWTGPRLDAMTRSDMQAASSLAPGELGREPEGANEATRRGTVAPGGYKPDMSQTTSRPAVAAASDEEQPRRLPGRSWLPRPGRSAYDRFVGAGMAAWAIVGMALAGFVLLRLVVALQVLVPPVLIAAAVVYLLDPVVARLHRRGLPRLLGTLLVYLVFVLLVGLALSVLIPLVTREIATAIDDFPQYATAMQGKLQQLAARFGQRDITISVEAARVSDWLGDPANRQTILNYVIGLGSFTGSVVHA